MWGGFFMVIPLISVHYVDGLGWAAAAIGLVLAVRQLTQQGLTLAAGALADKLGAKGLICIGMGIRALSFGAMGFANTFPELLASAFFAAVGGALFDSPSSAAITALSLSNERQRIFSLLGVVRGLGMTLGPLIGAWLLRFDFAYVALGAAGCYILTLLVTIVLFPSVAVASGERRLTEGIAMALHDRRFVAYNVLLLGYWCMWVQQTISIPLVARQIGGTTDAVGWVYALSAVISLVLQYPVFRFLEPRIKPMPILVIGLLLMAISIGLIGLATTFPALLVYVALFAVGGLLATPTQQTVSADLSDPTALGSYYGVSALSLAFGGSFGNLVGGALYGYGQQIGMPMLPWLFFGSIGAASALGMWLLHRRISRAQLVHRTEPIEVR